MIWHKMGEVVPGFHVLGSWHTPSYLWAGPKPVLFDAGMSFLGDLYVKHARRVLGERSPEILFLTHAHFDHCGAASTLRDAFPGLCIAASARAAEIVQRPGALELIRKLNEEARILAPVIEVDHPAPELAHTPSSRIRDAGENLLISCYHRVRIHSGEISVSYTVGSANTISVSEITRASSRSPSRASAESTSTATINARVSAAGTV